MFKDAIERDWGCDNHYNSYRVHTYTVNQFNLNQVMEWSLLTLSPLDGPYGSMTNTGKDNFSWGYAQNIVNVLMAVFDNSLRFHLTYLTMLSPEKRRFICLNS